METLILIGLIGGLITGISPCILPMLPVIFFAGGVDASRAKEAVPDGEAPLAEQLAEPGGAEPSRAEPGRAEPSLAASSGGPVTTDLKPPPAPPAQTKPQQPKPHARSLRPYLVILGLIISFSTFTLFGSLILGALGLPLDLLRWIGLTLLAIIGVGMIFPRVEEIIQWPFQRIATFGSDRGVVRRDRGGFILGLGLGVLYVPCAGPVLAAITVAGSTGHVDGGTVVLTISFAVGAAIPLLVFALAGRSIGERVRAFSSHTRGIRIAGGVVMLSLAVALAFNAPAYLQRLLPDYTGSLQQSVDQSGTVRDALAGVGGADTNSQLSQCPSAGTALQDCGPAPELTGLTNWLNTKDNQPLTIAGEKGKVVLIDFWAYSCINCQRAIPHVNGWYDRYKDAGLEVIGVHTPEFAFEHVPSNVVSGAQSLGIKYPVALDNDYGTWSAYDNHYWPAEYLIDANGNVRHIAFGEGGYQDTETLIRQLLTTANPNVKLPAASDVADSTPQTVTTPETYFNAARVSNYAGQPDYLPGTNSFVINGEQPKDTFSLGGDWTIDSQGATAASDGATIRLSYTASNVFAVLGGSGTVTATIHDSDNAPAGTQSIEVSGAPTLHTILTSKMPGTGIVDLTVPKGVQIFTFTFG